jgi:hypothetical protein
MKAKWGSKKHGPCCDPCGATTITGCASPLPPDAAPMAPGTGTNPPKEMPKPKDPPKVDPKPKGGNSTSIPLPLPAVPTVNGAGATSPY